MGDTLPITEARARFGSLLRRASGAWSLLSSVSRKVGRMNRVRPLLWLDIVLKVTLVAALLYAAANTDMERFSNKAMGLRAVVYPLVSLLVPAVWWLFGRGRVRFPVAISIAVTLPFLSDTLGNVFDLYDTVSWFDDVSHFVNWVPWVAAFGLFLHYWPLGRLNLAALTAGFGAATAILWEIGEYVAFITGNDKEMQGIYRDTIGDLALSLTGAITGAALVATVLWRHTDPTSPPGAE